MAGAVCDDCEAAAAQVRCDACELLLCQDCSKNVHKKALAEHVVVPLDADGEASVADIDSGGHPPPATFRLCDECEDEDAELECDDCALFFCGDCARRIHAEAPMSMHAVFEYDGNEVPGGHAEHPEEGVSFDEGDGHFSGTGEDGNGREEDGLQEPQDVEDNDVGQDKGDGEWMAGLEAETLRPPGSVPSSLASSGVSQTGSTGVEGAWEAKEAKDLDEVVKEGEMQKFAGKPGMFNSWQKRWFVVTHVAITYHPSKDKKTDVRGRIPLCDIVDIRASTADMKEARKSLFAFDIVTHNVAGTNAGDGDRGRSYTVHAPTREGSLEWIKVIQKLLAAQTLPVGRARYLAIRERFEDISILDNEAPEDGDRALVYDLEITFQQIGSKGERCLLILFTDVCLFAKLTGKNNKLLRGTHAIPLSELAVWEGDTPPSGIIVKDGVDLGVATFASVETKKVFQDVVAAQKRKNGLFGSIQGPTEEDNTLTWVSEKLRGEPVAHSTVLSDGVLFARLLGVLGAGLDRAEYHVAPATSADRIANLHAVRRRLEEDGVPLSVDMQAFLMGNPAALWQTARDMRAFYEAVVGENLVVVNPAVKKSRSRKFRASVMLHDKDLEEQPLSEEPWDLWLQFEKAEALVHLPLDPSLELELCLQSLISTGVDELDQKAALEVVRGSPEVATAIALADVHIDRTLALISQSKQEVEDEKRIRNAQASRSVRSPSDVDAPLRRASVAVVGEGGVSLANQVAVSRTPSMEHLVGAPPPPLEPLSDEDDEEGGGEGGVEDDVDGGGDNNVPHCIEAPLSTLRHSGKLFRLKEGGGFLAHLRWEKFWCTLTKEALSFYLAKELVDVMMVADVTEVRASAHAKRNPGAFELVLPNKTMVLRGHTLEDSMAWLKEISLLCSPHEAASGGEGTPRGSGCVGTTVKTMEDVAEMGKEEMAASLSKTVELEASRGKQRGGIVSMLGMYDSGSAPHAMAEAQLKEVDAELDALSNLRDTLVVALLAHMTEAEIDAILEAARSA